MTAARAAGRRNALLQAGACTLMAVQIAGAAFVVYAVRRVLNVRAQFGNQEFECFLTSNGSRVALCNAAYGISAVSLAISVVISILQIGKWTRAFAFARTTGTHALLAAVATTGWAFLAAALTVSTAELDELAQPPAWDTRRVGAHRDAVLAIAWIEAAAFVAVALCALKMTYSYPAPPLRAPQSGVKELDVMLTTTATFVTDGSFSHGSSPSGASSMGLSKAFAELSPRTRPVVVDGMPQAGIGSKSLRKGP